MVYRQTLIKICYVIFSLNTNESTRCRHYFIQIPTRLRRTEITLVVCSQSFLFYSILYTHTHTRIHTNIYIYIYIYIASSLTEEKFNRKPSLLISTYLGCCNLFLCSPVLKSFALIYVASKGQREYGETT